MKILFFACTLLSALLLTLPPFLYRQTEDITECEPKTADVFVTDAEITPAETTAQVIETSDPLPMTTATADTETEPCAVETESDAIMVSDAPTAKVQPDPVKAVVVDTWHDSRIKLRITVFKV